jgi:shikimate dehydrogenase
MTDRYAVIGNPVAHSKSPWIHAEFARSTRQDIEYLRIEAPHDGFARTVEEFPQREGPGRKRDAAVQGSSLSLLR